MDEDEVDILGDFDLESLLDKNESRLLCYDNSLGCGDYNVLPWQWTLEAGASPQSAWEFDKNDNITFNNNNNNSTNQLLYEAPACDSYGWSDKERYLLEKGLELFGESWCRLSQYIGSKTDNQVRNYVRNGAGSLLALSVLSQTDSPRAADSLASASPPLYSFPDIVDDADIPASLEEVITVVSTAHLTIPRTISKEKKTQRRRVVSLKSVRKELARMRINQSRRRPKGPSSFNVIKEKPKLKSVNYNVVCRVNRNEEIVKIRYDETSEDSDVDIEDDGSVAVPVPEAAVPTGDGNVEDEGRTEDDIQSDEQPSQSRSREGADRLPRPTQEVEVDPESVSGQEIEFHPEFFKDARDPDALRSRYLKIRNHIIDCWKMSRPNYVTKTSVRSGLKNCGDVNLIGRIHAYLEQIGAINFGCEQCNYNATACGTSLDEEGNIQTVNHKENRDIQKESRAQSENNNSITIATRTRRKRVWSPCLVERGCGGGLTMVHDATGAVTHIYDAPDKLNGPRPPTGKKRKNRHHKYSRHRKYPQED